MSSYRMAQGHDGRLRARGTNEQHTSTADDDLEPTDPWPFGAVVAFRRKKGAAGFGQVERTTPTGLITVRTWLPCPTRTVTLTADDVRLVATPGQLHAWLQGHR